MGIILSSASLLIIALLGNIIRKNIKTINNLEYNVELLKNANKLDHNKVNQKFDKFEHNYNKKLYNLKTEISESQINLSNKITSGDLNVEESTKKYLNSWRNSTEFKTMLELIKKAEQSSTTKNIY